MFPAFDHVPLDGEPGSASRARRRARVGPSHRLAILVVAVLIGTATWGRLSPGPAFFLARPGSPSLRLLLPVSVAPGDDGSLRVSVTVRNVGRVVVQGRVWWELAEPGRGSLWDRRVYQSMLTPVELGPGDEVPLAWEEFPEVPGGTYDVAAWAHTRRGPRYEPADGQPGTPRTVLLEGSTEPLLRRGPPRAGVKVAAVEIPAASTELAHAAPDVVITNGTATPQQVRVSWHVVTADAGPEAYWWRNWKAEAGADQEVVVQPGTMTVHLAALRGVSTGTYAVRVTLALRGHPPGWADQLEWPDDDVLLPARTGAATR